MGHQGFETDTNCHCGSTDADTATQSLTRVNFVCNFSIDYDSIILQLLNYSFARLLEYSKSPGIRDIWKLRPKGVPQDWVKYYRSTMLCCTISPIDRFVSSFSLDNMGVARRW